MIQNNRSLTIYTARQRTDRVLQAEPLDVQGLFDRLADSRTIPMTHDAYVALPKPQQDSLKDVGAFIAGELKNGRRRRDCILSRNAVVLDADNLPAGGTDDFVRAVVGLNACCCIYSTAKHSPATPRLRVVIPLSSDIPAEQYPLVVRLLCQRIQPEMSWFDPTTSEAGRIMYYPAHCQDVAPVYYVQDGGGLLDAAGLMARLPDWQDVNSWPVFPREQVPARLAAKQQQDPEAKAGVVGAFCKAYNVPAAMDFYPASMRKRLQRAATRSQAALRLAVLYSTMMGSSSTPTTPLTLPGESWSMRSIWCGYIYSRSGMTAQNRGHR